jgi:hypothetical protein
MRALPAVLVAVLALGGCASKWSRVEISSPKPVSIVANCISQQWSAHYSDVSVVAYATGMTVRANFGTAMPIQADVLWTAFGSRVRFSTAHHELVLREHPAVRTARACAA